LEVKTRRGPSEEHQGAVKESSDEPGRRGSAKPTNNPRQPDDAWEGNDPAEEQAPMEKGEKSAPAAKRPFG